MTRLRIRLARSLVRLAARVNTAAAAASLGAYTEQLVGRFTDDQLEALRAEFQGAHDAIGGQIVRRLAEADR